jgi:hypothetical protein
VYPDQLIPVDPCPDFETGVVFKKTMPVLHCFVLFVRVVGVIIFNILDSILKFSGIF